jgi:tetratricopeptide (TPR) repeat protein
MKRGLAIVAGVALVCAVAYLSWLNPTSVTLHLSTTYTIQAPLSVLLVLAFVVGAVLVLTGLLIQGTRRSLAEWWRGRAQRRAERADSLEQRGEELLWAGDSERARSLLLRAWRRSPNHRRAALVVAGSYLDEGNAAAAERVVRDALDRHRGDPELLLALSEACTRQDNRPGAIQALEQLRAQHPRATRGLTALRNQYVAAGRWAEALSVQSLYLRTLSQPPRITQERQRLVGLQYEAAMAKPAPSDRVTALERLVDDHAGFTPALVSLGDALVADGREAEAVDLWERAIRTTPRTVFLERLLRHMTQPRQRQQLRQQLRKARAQSIRPECLQLWQARMQLLDGEAAEVLQEINSIAPPLSESSFFHKLRAEALRQLGHLDQALADYAAVADAMAPYVCHACGRHANAWVGRCPQCGSWDSYRAAVEIAAD